MQILDFFLFLWVIFALLDPDPATQINADPKPWSSLQSHISSPVCVKVRGEWELAKTCYQDSLSINPHHLASLQSHISSPVCVKVRGEWELAKTCYQDSLSINPHAFPPSSPKYQVLSVLRCGESGS
jgi:hypothetical protein